MKRTRKVILVAVFGLATLIAAVFVYVSLLDVNQYKAELVELVESTSGRRFVINGDIGLKLSLVPTLVVDGLALGNASWAAHDNMVTVARAEARLALVPLVWGDIKLRRVLISGARVFVEIDAKGRTNWTFSETDSDDDVSVLPGLDLDQMAITDAIIEFRKTEEPVKVFEVEQLNLTPNGFGQPLDVSARIKALGIPITVSGRTDPIRSIFRNEPYAFALAAEVFDVTLDARGRIEEPLVPRGVDVALQASAATLNHLVEALDVSIPIDGPLRFDGAIKDAQETINVDVTELIFAESILTGTMAFGERRGHPSIRADISQARIVLPNSGEPTESGDDERVFSSQKWPIDSLRTLDLELRLANVAVIHDSAALENLQGAVVVARENLTVESLTANLAGGEVRLDLDMDLSREVPQIETKINVDQMSLGKLALFERDASLSGGITRIAIEVIGSGDSMAGVMSSANGSLAIDVQRAHIPSGVARAASSDLLMSVVHAISPGRGAGSGTDLECVAVRMPIKNGVARNETAFGFQTSELSVLGGGQLEFATEAIDFGIKPKPREGIGINVSSLADFVRIGGTLSKPAVGTDIQGVTTAGLKVGAAVATLGLSVLAEGVFDRMTAETDVCALARGEVTTQSTVEAPETTATKAKNAVKDAGTKVKSVFKGLFGD